MKKLFVVFAIFFYSLIIAAQNNNLGTGLIFDDKAYSKNQVAANLSRGEYDKMPPRVSLKQYAPTPGDQGKTGTCVAWSSAYHAYTIAESIKLERTQRQITDNETFSPSFIYNQIREEEGCLEGTSIDRALDAMKNYGNLKLRSFPFNCEAKIKRSDITLANNNKISDYRVLFVAESNQKIQPVKKAISERNPVVIGMVCCLPSFFKMNSSGFWVPSREEYNVSLPGGHAMAVVGYDDTNLGGSFQVINSWGTGWGDGGYFWIKYSDFNTFVKYAYEMILVSPPIVDLNGEVEFKLLSGEKMEATFDQNVGIYKMKKPYMSGCQFRFYMNNSQPAYVYALGSDLSKKSYPIFPYSDSVSAYLGYKSNMVAIPDESHYIYMDNNIGKDYFCILYSKNKLNISEILTNLENVSGDFRTRLQKVLKNELVDSNQIKYKKDAISFEANSGDKAIVPIIIEIIHN